MREGSQQGHSARVASERSPRRCRQDTKSVVFKISVITTLEVSLMAHSKRKGSGVLRILTRLKMRKIPWTGKSGHARVHSITESDVTEELKHENEVMHNHTKYAY